MEGTGSRTRTLRGGGNKGTFGDSRREITRSGGSGGVQDGYPTRVLSKTGSSTVNPR